METVTTKTYRELAAEFAAVFKDVKPVGVLKPATQAERLAPYRPHVLKQRRRGLTWKQIADGMADARINVRVTERILRTYFSGDEKAAGATATTTTPATATPVSTPSSATPAPAPTTTATTTPATPPKPASRRLILDPLTGLPITPAANAPVQSMPNDAPVPSPSPMTPREHEQFDPLLQGLIPPIVKTRTNRRDARAYASNAVERLRPAEAERFQEILAAELDALDETNCARYGVAPEMIKPWKRRWV